MSGKAVGIQSYLLEQIELLAVKKDQELSSLWNKSIENTIKWLKFKFKLKIKDFQNALPGPLDYLNFV